MIALLPVDYVATLDADLKTELDVLAAEFGGAGALAAEEAGHYRMFIELSAREDIAGQIGAEVRIPASDRKFSDAVLLPDLGEHPDDQTLLRYALGREHTAMEQYRSLADSTEPGPVHDLFEFLSNEETKHKNELEQLYYEVVHSGGV